MNEIRSGFAAWLQGQAGFADATITSLAPVEGGASNLTLRVTLDGGPVAAAALRIQRDSGIFQPYDVIREGEVIRALGGTDVPVPKVLGVEPDRTVLGAPFVVLEWVDAPHMGVAGPDADFGAFTAMVARIHAVDWRSGRFWMLRTPASTAEATAGEIAAVAARIDAFRARTEILDEAQRLLEQRIPGDGDLCLCQGDINVFNFLFRKRQVVAVVDWEQAHIGDPQSDIGQLLALSHLKGAPFGEASSMPFAQAYAAASGRRPGGLAFFRALWAWQLAFIHRAWTATNDSPPWYSWDEAATLLEQCLDELR